jgi:hypothetical protein
VYQLLKTIRDFDRQKINGESIWKIHYIQNDIEYLNGEYSMEKSAREDLKNYNV